jgi:hypothetical protein
MRPFFTRHNGHLTCCGGRVPYVKANTATIYEGTVPQARERQSTATKGDVSTRKASPMLTSSTPQSSYVVWRKKVLGVRGAKRFALRLSSAAGRTCGELQPGAQQPVQAAGDEQWGG